MGLYLQVLRVSIQAISWYEPLETFGETINNDKTSGTVIFN